MCCVSFCYNICKSNALPWGGGGVCVVCVGGGGGGLSL